MPVRTPEGVALADYCFSVLLYVVAVVMDSNKMPINWLVYVRSSKWMAQIQSHSCLPSHALILFDQLCLSHPLSLQSAEWYKLSEHAAGLLCLHQQYSKQHAWDCSRTVSVCTTDSWESFNFWGVGWGGVGESFKPRPGVTCDGNHLCLRQWHTIVLP